MFGKKSKAPVDHTEQELQSVEKEYQQEVRLTKLRPILINGVLFIWAGLDLIILAIAVIGIALYLVNGSFVDKRLTSRFAANTEVQRVASINQQAVSLVIENDPRIFDLGDGRYDFYSEIENPNDGFLAELEWQFGFDGGETEGGSVVIGPGQKLPIAALSEKLDGSPGTVTLDISKLKWRRVDVGNIDGTVSGLSPTAFLEQRSQFVVTGAAHGRIGLIRPVAISEDSTPGTGSVTPAGNTIQSIATIKNNSAYGFWDAPFYVVVRRAGTPVGVNFVTLKGFESGEEREVAVRWFGDAPVTGEVEFIPAINFFDSDVYMPLDDDTAPERFF